MPSNLNLDYYCGTEADQYSFYRIPKILLTDSRYRNVSIEAKVFYCVADYDVQPVEQTRVGVVGLVLMGIDRRPPG